VTTHRTSLAAKVESKSKQIGRELKAHNNDKDIEFESNKSKIVKEIL